MQNTESYVDGLKYAATVAPGAVVTGSSILGLPLQDWMYICTILFTLLQTGYFIWKLVHKEKQKLIKEVEEAKSNGG